MRLILVRHGETSWNQERRIQGHSDVELNTLGEKQGESLGQVLKNQPITAIYSSPLQRALKTAQSIACYHHLPVNTDPNLMEIDHGELEGLTTEEMRSRYPDFLKRWTADSAEATIPGGEPLTQLQSRAWEAIQRIRALHPQETVVLVGHRFVLGAILCRAIGLSLSHFRRLTLAIASMSILDWNGERASLTLLNDTCHLTKEKPP
ncbi:MAG: histidine phosphatase family protein [Chloroflexi bacterium]|nr:histidine phosphatase family protein [Chloroflexota bacterium]